MIQQQNTAVLPVLWQLEEISVVELQLILLLLILAAGLMITRISTMELVEHVVKSIAVAELCHMIQQLIPAAVVMISITSSMELVTHVVYIWHMIQQQNTAVLPVLWQLEEISVVEL